MVRQRVLIAGAAGRDFHNFNVFYRENRDYEVVAFTAAQIPRISGRVYPPELAGSLYPAGIPIQPEDEIERLVRELRVDEVVFSYSDVSHEHVMHIASRAAAAGADYRLLGPRRTMLASSKPVVAVCAVRTGAGKSQVSRYISGRLMAKGRRAAAIRHPMPYGDLKEQAVQRYAQYDDLVRFRCTIEEREEYEAHLANGVVVYAGVDYEKILRQAEGEAEIIIWDGGNNDLPFIRPDMWITVADPFRTGHELRYHPGETNLRAADVILINKANTAPEDRVSALRTTIRECNPRATVVVAASEVTVADPEAIRGKRVLCIEDGPTLTHGEMSFGAGQVAARRYGAGEIVDPRDAAVGSIGEAFRKYPHIGRLLPAVGYYDEQIRDLEESIRRVDCDLVLVATPIDLARVVRIDRPHIQVRYELADMGSPTLGELVDRFIEQH